MNFTQRKIARSSAHRANVWCWRIAAMFGLWLLQVPLCQAQNESAFHISAPAHSNTPLACSNPTSPAAVKEALRLVCTNDLDTPGPVHAALIVCFLGGFVKSSDLKHPEVWFARYLRDRYGSDVHVLVFTNRDEAQALRDAAQFMAAHSKSGQKVAPQPVIIVYGHSWGGSQVLTFARDLDKVGIPVSLSIQIDSVRKWGQNDRAVPHNVLKAINFYQTRGLTHSERHISTDDPARTLILGNLRMNYDHVHIDCSNYKLLSRLFNKPHHQIENDPRVWKSIAALIDTEITSR